MSRTGTTPHQHAILLHEYADLMRASADPPGLSTHELVELVDDMRGWMARNVGRLLDDSRALNEIVAQQSAPAEAEVPDG